jgi:ParB family chromosome partitioning protein
MATVVKETSAPAGEYQLVPIGIIEVDKGFNNRRSLGDVTELAASIKSVGLLQPLLVWRRELGVAATEEAFKGKGFLHVIAGHRRLAASKLAGLSHVHVIVVEQDEKSRLESLLVENLHRLDIDPLEEADGYKRLVDFGLKQQDIAAKVGRSPAHVSKRLSLLELPDEVHQLVIAGKLHIADALELSPYAKDPEVIEETLQHLRESIKNGWGFRVEDHARGAARRVSERRKRETAIAKLEADGISILKSSSEYSLPAGATALGNGYRELPIKVAEHAKSPCHAAFVSTDGNVIYLCTKAANHKDSREKAVVKALADIKRSNSYSSPSRGDGKAAKEQAKKAAESRERNKVLRIREPLRTAELKRLLTARQKRDDVLDFVLRQLLQRFLDESPEVANLTAQLLELPMSAAKRNSWEQPKVNWAAYISSGNDKLFRLAYAVALASGEWPFRMLVQKGFFDQEFSTNAERYVEHLKANGYAPDKVEKAQLTRSTDRYRPAFDKARGKEKS